MPGLVDLNLVRDGRPRADHAHLPAEDVDQLRQLVKVAASQESANPRHARILLEREPRGACGDGGFISVRGSAADQLLDVTAVGLLVGGGVHGAELVEHEGPPAEPDALLSEQDISPRLHAYRCGDSEHQRRGQDQPDR